MKAVLVPLFGVVIPVHITLSVTGTVGLTGESSIFSLMKAEVDTSS